jgi:hypothetical protein
LRKECRESEGNASEPVRIERIFDTKKLSALGAERLFK